MIKDTWKPRSRVLPSEWSDGLMDSWVISPQHFPWSHFFESRFQTHTPEENHLSQQNPSKKLKIWNLRKKSPSNNGSDHESTQQPWLNPPWLMTPSLINTSTGWTTTEPPNSGGHLFQHLCSNVPRYPVKDHGLDGLLEKHVRLSGFNSQYMRLTGKCYMYFALCKYISISRS